MNNTFHHETPAEQSDICGLNKTNSHEALHNSAFHQRLRQEDLILIAQCNEDALPAIMTSFHDSRATIRATAAALASSLQIENDELLLDALCDALFDTDVNVREMSALSISEMQPLSCRVISRLIESLEWEGNTWVLIHVLTALRKAGKNAIDSAPTIINLLSGTSIPICIHSAKALGSIGKETHLADLSLTNALNHPHEAVRQSAQQALNQIG